MKHDIQVSVLGNGKYRLLTDRTDQLIYGDNPWSHTVPAGTTTDFASIPRWLQWVYRPTEPWIVRASLHHDKFYRTHAVPREVADGWFKRMCKEDGATFVQRTLVWLAVTVGGDKAYHRAGERYRNGKS